MSKRSQLPFRGPLQAFPTVGGQAPLGYITSAPKPMDVWLCSKAVNSLRLDVGELVGRPMLADLIELDPADVTISPPTGEHGQVYVDATEWLRLGGRAGPDVTARDPVGERPSERAMRLTGGGKHAAPTKGGR